MSTRLIMTVSALVLGVLGILLLFLPDETATLLELPPGSSFGLELASGGFLGMAVLNWMGRGAVYGGIFGRPITTANATLGVILTTSLFTPTLGTLGWLGFGVFLVYTLVFARIMFRGPGEAP